MTTKESDRNKISALFHQKYGKEDWVVMAPGRINLIGEHTDYNEGLVLPAAIDCYVTLYINKNNSQECRIDALDINESYAFNIDDSLSPTTTGWVNYFLGVLKGVSELVHMGHGFNVMFTSSIPIGAGLSSSAAIECGIGLAISKLYGLSIDPMDLAKIGQKAEHDFAGVQCGIMDQFAVVMGKAHQAIKLDCRTLAFDYIPAQFDGYDMVLFDTQVKHDLASSEYNIRRQQCEEGVAFIRQVYPEVTALRDVSLTMLNEARPYMSSVIYRRCQYVIEENNRVLKACEALETNDIMALGVLMYQSHHGLSMLYDVSCRELNILVDIARNSGQVAGSRMMGGGFGGCTINLIESTYVEEVLNMIKKEYFNQIGKHIKVYPVQISDGVRTINL